VKNELEKVLRYVAERRCNRAHPIDLGELLSTGYIELSTVSRDQHSAYVLTDKGRAYFEDREEEVKPWLYDWTTGTRRMP